ncbi:glycosyltransferase family 4 protein [Lacinutrix venerupis]|uniref:Glycosyltransferase n=1 Tax=Lacinutrix venerupis TaxID=1486034 RepID=A0AAC9LNN2_9FLAO|nr:glycosyltransferase family 4 protein [Lacinutrix venerupis]APY00717.1 glycosyltransferase [Lacinutrix venerupis]
MRVLQLIDSLHPGGAERVAVNIANALVSKIEASYLCATREEGLLKESINPQVNYLFLNKTKTIDAKAIKTLSAFVKQNKIDLIHAHSTSFFLATVTKILNNKVKIVWHDHYGQSEFLEARSFKMLKICSRYFSQIYSVNETLENWAKHKLNCKKVSYISNFAVDIEFDKITRLNGLAGKRIIHLANLREQKDHFTLFTAFAEVVKKYPEWTLHCVGKDFNDDYSKAIQKSVKQLQLGKSVFIYGSKIDVSNILSQCEIAVLSSQSEGLPMALLEYGLAALPTIATQVGNCNLVIKNETLGQLIKPKMPNILANALMYYIENSEKSKIIGEQLKKHVEAHFSSHAISKLLINDYNTIL